MAYASLEPFGEERADLRSAIVAVVMAKSLGGKKAQHLTVRDFMPDFERRTGKQWTDEQLLAWEAAMSKVVNQTTRKR